MLSESQRRTNNVCRRSYVESKTYNKAMNKTTKKKQTHWYREQTSGEREGRRGNLGVGEKGLLWDYMKSCV